jgi:hypothetical protein
MPLENPPPKSPGGNKRNAAVLLSQNLAHADDGGVVPISHFDYAKIDADLFSSADFEGDNSELSAEEMQRALKFVRSVMGWIAQNGMKNPEGVKIRALIACWVLLEYLHPLTLTELANGFGKHKQSLGRWVDDWKVKFPQLRNPHLKAIDEKEKRPAT